MSLSYEDISFYFKYDNNPVELKKWLRKVVPVADFASLTHDIVIDIENGKSAAVGARGRQTCGLLGYYSIVLHSAAHFTGTEFIRFLCGNIAAFLGVQDPGLALILCDDLVTDTRTESRIFQDDVAKLLVPKVEDYCKNHFGECKIPIASAESRPSRLYSKDPDQSYQPSYYVRADNDIDLPTAICEVTMGGQVGRLLFNCLSCIAGSRGKIDLSIGVDIAFDNHHLTGIRVFVFDTTITTLVRFAENASVARFTRGKIDNRLIHLRYLRDHLHEQERFEDYLQLEHAIEPTIQYYERMQEYLIAISGGQVTDEDIVETTRVVLHNAEVVQMTMEDREFSVTDINGEPLGGLAVKVEAFLGLILGFEAQVVLDISVLRKICLGIACDCKKDQLGWIPVPTSLVLTKRHIANEKYSEFVAGQGADFELESFEQGQPVKAHKVALGHLSEENVIDRLAEVYLGKHARSKDVRTAAAYSLLKSKFTEYDLTQDFNPQQDVARSPESLWPRDYTNLVNELLEIHPTTPEEREYFRRVLDHRAISDMLYISSYKQALAQIIHERGSLTALIEELGRDENEAQFLLQDLLEKAGYTSESDEYVSDF